MENFLGHNRAHGGYAGHHRRGRGFSQSFRDTLDSPTSDTGILHEDIDDATPSEPVKEGLRANCQAEGYDGGANQSASKETDILVVSEKRGRFSISRPDMRPRDDESHFGGRDGDCGDDSEDSFGKTSRVKRRWASNAQPVDDITDLDPQPDATGNLDDIRHDASAGAYVALTILQTSPMSPCRLWTRRRLSFLFGFPARRLQLLLTMTGKFISAVRSNSDDIGEFFWAVSLAAVTAWVSNVGFITVLVEFNSGEARPFFSVRRFDVSDVSDVQDPTLRSDQRVGARMKMRVR